MINPLSGKAASLKKEFDLFRDRVGFYLRAKRGRCSDLARDIGVRRQTVWRWFYNRWSNVPGWAAVAVNVWYYQHVPQAVDQELRELQQLGPLSDPRPKFVPRSGDNGVSPQADNSGPPAPEPALRSVAPVPALIDRLAPDPALLQGSPALLRRAPKIQPKVLPLP